jgi:hypothetical protein
VRRVLDQKVVKFLLINKRDAGVTLLELLLAIMIVAAATATMLRQFSKKKKFPIKEVVAECQENIHSAFYKAIREKKIYAIHFFFRDHGVLAQIGHQVYNRSENQSNVVLNKKNVSAEVRVNSFIVNGKDEMQQKSEQIWLLAYPDGHLQELTFSLQTDTGDPVFFTVNPFTGFIDYAS